MSVWKVVPICKNQLQDVNKEDIVKGGDFRICNVDRANVYDKFPEIAKKRFDMKELNYNEQFIVQVYGCPLDCWYCYVTEAGVWGNYKEYKTEEIISIFRETGQDIFHLMGGAPALYLNKWPELINKLKDNEIFHSDLLLIEREYNLSTLKDIAKDNCLYAVNIKGVTPQDFKRNTSCELDRELFWSNFEKIVDADLNFYITFTNPNKDKLKDFKSKLIDRFSEDVLKDSFVITPVNYNAVDNEKFDAKNLTKESR